MVLIGAGQFRELHQLPATHRNVKALADLLTNAWNLPLENCTVLRDPASPRDLSRAVEEAAKEATDTLLVYYAGHGLIDRAGHYHLAVQSSEPASVHDTAALYDWIKAQIEKSRAERRIVILDCCFAARAFGLQSDTAALEVAGTYVLAAAGETATAISPPGEHFTAFTGALLSVLSDGVPGLSRYLDLDTVFRQLNKELASRNGPRPAQLCRDHLGRAPFIKNAAYQPPEDILPSAPPARRAPTAATSKDRGKPPPSPTPATAMAGGPSADTPDKKPVPVMQRKIVRYAGLPVAWLALLFGVWSAYAVSSISYADSPKLQEIHKRGFINVGIKGDLPGLSYQESGQWKGFEIDLARKIAASLGFTADQVKFVQVTTDNRGNRLQGGSVDFVVSTWSMDGDQAKRTKADPNAPLSFVGPYYTSGLAALVWDSKEVADSIEKIDDIKKLNYPPEKICTASGSTSEDELKKRNIQHITKGKYDTCWEDLNVNVVVTDEIILAALNEENNYADGSRKGHVLRLDETTERYGVGIRAGDPIFEYLTCQALQKDWNQSVTNNLQKMATEQLGKEWTPPLVDFPECSRLHVWGYKLRNII